MSQTYDISKCIFQIVKVGNIKGLHNHICKVKGITKLSLRREFNFFLLSDLGKVL